MKEFVCMNCGIRFKGYKERKYCSIRCCSNHKSKYEKCLGKRFGKLVIIGIDNNKFICKCDCNNTKLIDMANVFNGRTKSCGCLQKEFIKNNKINLKHDKCNTRIYKIWCDMKSRCYNVNYNQYYLYGGKGIKICNEWKNDFMTFYNWAINNGYKKNLSIDRIDNNGNYEPNNCRWATNNEQARNKSNNINITYNGETHCIAEWSSMLNIKQSTLYWRYKNWGNINKIFSK